MMHVDHMSKRVRKIDLIDEDNALVAACGTVLTEQLTQQFEQPNALGRDERRTRELAVGLQLERPSAKIGSQLGQFTVETRRLLVTALAVRLGLHCAEFVRDFLQLIYDGFAEVKEEARHTTLDQHVTRMPHNLLLLLQA